MKTRFEQYEYWIDGFRTRIDLEQLETSHLINIVKMFLTKPEIIRSMLIEDISNNHNGIWSIEKDSKKESIWNITSLKTDELITYAFSSSLLEKIRLILEERGVNYENIILCHIEERDLNKDFINVLNYKFDKDEKSIKQFEGGLY